MDDKLYLLLVVCFTRNHQQAHAVSFEAELHD